MENSEETHPDSPDLPVEEGDEVEPETEPRIGDPGAPPDPEEPDAGDAEDEREPADPGAEAG